MTSNKTVAASGTPISPDLSAAVLEPFIAAVRMCIGEMAAVNVEQTPRREAAAPVSGISVLVELESPIKKALVLSFPRPTAIGLARRILSDVAVDLDEELIRDCMCEIGNVVCGQAKALCADTPHAFRFSLPKVVNACELDSISGGILAMFACDLGPFELRVFLSR